MNLSKFEMQESHYSKRATIFIILNFGTNNSSKYVTSLIHKAETKNLQWKEKETNNSSNQMNPFVKTLIFTQLIVQEWRKEPYFQKYPHQNQQAEARKAYTISIVARKQSIIHTDILRWNKWRISTQTNIKIHALHQINWFRLRLINNRPKNSKTQMKNYLVWFN